MRKKKAKREHLRLKERRRKDASPHVADESQSQSHKCGEGSAIFKFFRPQWMRIQSFDSSK